MTQAVFDRVARFYDYEQENFTQDIPFYVAYAKKCKGEVLELACGTGRILIPIAKAGLRITGLDVSKNMLELARKKVAMLDNQTKQKIRLGQQDMSNFELRRKFALIYIAFRSFQSLVTRESQESCLACVNRHLENKGLLIIDLFAPKHDYLAKPRRKVDLGKFYDGENKIYIRRRAEDEYDLAKQTLKEARFYEWTDRDGKFHKLKWSFELSYLFRYETELLLQKYGFEVLDVFGDFKKSPYNYYSGEQIFVACKAS